MSVYKDEKTNTWKVYYRYTDWQGKPIKNADLKGITSIPSQVLRSPRGLWGVAPLSADNSPARAFILKGGGMNGRT